MITLHRITLSAINAFFITVCLLYLMYQLVHINEPELLEKTVFTLPPIKNIPDEEKPIFGFQKPSQPKEVAPTPISPKLIPQTEFDSIDEHWADYEVRKPIKTLSTLDSSQLVLALGYPPTYPGSAIKKEIEGYVVVGFVLVHQERFLIHLLLNPNQKVFLSVLP